MNDKIYVCLECQERLLWRPDLGHWLCPECGDGFNPNLESMPDCFEELTSIEWKRTQREIRQNRAFDDFVRTLNDPDNNYPLWD